jgi:predicted MFS family arabinose efflux permease
LWSVLFDRWALLRFRTAHMIVWVLSRLILAIGVWQQSLFLIGICLALEGAAFGAGRLSWQLGHMSFARVQDDAIYMGLHQALTGVRGLIMPLVGALLYRYVCGWHVVWVSLAIMAISAWGFWWMHRRCEAGTGRGASSPS